MKKAPGFWFFTGDWLKDPELRFCSIFARGLLVDLLCYMFEAKEQGYLTWADGSARSDREIVDAISGGSTEEKLSALHELLKKGVLSRDSRGAVYSRRLSKLKEVSEARRKSGSKGGSKTQANLKQTANQTTKQKRGVTDTVSDSDSVLDSDLNTKKKDSPEPSRASPPVKEPKGKKKPKPDFSEHPLPKEIDTPQMREAWRMWCKHRKEIGHALTETQMLAQLKEFVKVGEPQATRGIEYTVSRGWQGLRYPDESEQIPAKPREKTQAEKDAILAEARAQRAREDGRHGA